MLRATIGQRGTTRLVIAPIIFVVWGSLAIALQVGQSLVLLEGSERSNPFSPSWLVLICGVCHGAFGVRLWQARRFAERLGAWAWGLRLGAWGA